ncbi:MAG: hypothetical protein AAFU79_02260 [Myxococcota bacterium]
MAVLDQIRGEAPAAPSELASLLDVLLRMESGPGLPEPLKTNAARVARLAEAVFEAPSAIAEEDFEALCHFSEDLSLIFRVAGVDTGAMKDRVRGQGPLQDNLRYWPLCRLENITQEDLRALDALGPDRRLPVVASLLGQKLVHRPEAEEVRMELLRRSEPLLRDSRLRLLPMFKLGRAWMSCSYSSFAAKHDFKRHANQLMRGWLTETGATAFEVGPRPRASSRPHVVVMAERMRLGHAMHRCFAPSIQEMRERFRVTLIAEQKHLDEHSAELADEVIPLVNDVMDFAGIARLVSSKEPDIVYYPSIGMALWAIFTSNLRLAPIQVMALGHPATSRSPCIDWAVLEEDYVGSEACLSERVYFMRAFGLRFAPGTAHREPEIRERPSAIRVAVPANGLKLNGHFVETLREIQEKATRPIEFHFFPACDQQLKFESLRLDLEELLGPVTVYPMADYATHLEHISSCDLHLSPFPFGGTNSNIDSLHLGLPIVALDGLEICARSDALILRRVGLDDLLASTRDEYVARALRLIQDDSYRIQISRQIVAGGGARPFLEGGLSEKRDGEFSKALAYIYGLSQQGMDASCPKVHSYRDAEERGSVRPAGPRARSRKPLKRTARSSKKRASRRQR